ncbi:MAG: hypothetical protein KBS57_06675 [Alistipes sp.]|nr:hypothetical protein [Candidatus Minthomonas equi]
MIKRKKEYTLPLCILWGIFSSGTAIAQNYDDIRQPADSVTVQSLSERIFKIEKKNDAFNLLFDIRGGVYDTFDGETDRAKLAISYFRPRICGTIGKWSYLIRLNCLGNYDRTRDGANSLVDILMVSFRPNEHWSFDFGKKWFNYGAYEFQDDALRILEFFEYDYYVQDGGFGLTADASYHFGKQTIGFQIANASRMDLYENYPAAKGHIEKNRAPFQYTVNWIGSLFNDHLNTYWSYTLLNQAKNCFTSQVSLGTKLKFRKWEFVLDYFGASGDLDHLGIINSDAVTTGYTSIKGGSAMITDVKYNNIIGQFEFRPGQRWNILLKGGVTTSSTDNVEMFHNYRTTYEYTAAVQFFPDLTQDLRISLAYIGRHHRFTTACGLDNIDYGRLELSLIYKLKAY